MKTLLKYLIRHESRHFSGSFFFRRFFSIAILRLLPPPPLSLSPLSFRSTSKKAIVRSLFYTFSVFLNDVILLMYSGLTIPRLLVFFINTIIFWLLIKFDFPSSPSPPLPLPTFRTFYNIFAFFSLFHRQLSFLYSLLIFLCKINFTELINNFS